MGRLTTHVLDTASGRPAAGLKLTLDRVDGARHRLRDAVTNADGRVGAPLLEGTLDPGQYEIVFHAGEYLKAAGASLPEPAFFDEIPIRFGIAEPDGHYHVPLLLSPFGYSTYRGS